MTPTEEREMHCLAVILADLTDGTGWEAMRYAAIGTMMQRLSEYAAPCACIAKRNKQKQRFLAPEVTRE